MEPKSYFRYELLVIRASSNLCQAEIQYPLVSRSLKEFNQAPCWLTMEASSLTQPPPGPFHVSSAMPSAARRSYLCHGAPHLSTSAGAGLIAENPHKISCAYSSALSWQYRQHISLFLAVMTCWIDKFLPR
jgi:hypothetical protein